MSERSLVQRLGIKSDYKILILNAPDGYMGLLGELPSDTTVATELASD